MDFNNVRRASSAGYRLPERAKESRSITKQAPAAESLQKRKDMIASSTRHADASDPVKQGQAWKEMVWSERRAVLEWEKNWSFLRNYDQLRAVVCPSPPLLLSAERRHRDVTHTYSPIKCGFRERKKRLPVRSRLPSFTSKIRLSEQGELKTDEPFPDNSSFFSNCYPNTSNQIFGSRLSTPLGRELIRLDRIISWSGSHHKCKQDPEMMSC
ncbi:ciliary microtubule inner protein 5 isoform X1 [Vanacampus margaritifer]